MSLKEKVTTFIKDKESQGWTGKQAAEFFATTPAQVGKWMKGDACPTTDALEKIISVEGGQLEETSQSIPTEIMEWPEANMVILRPSWRNMGTLSHFAEIAHIKKMGAKLGVDVKTSTGPHKAKNVLLTQFLERTNKPNWALMWDDDMVPPFGKASVLKGKTGANIPDEYGNVFGGIRLAERAQANGLTLIGGLYRTRTPRNQVSNREFMYAEAQENGQEAARARKAPFNEYKETKWVGMGFTLIHRSVLQDMVDKVDGVKSRTAGRPHDFVTPIAGNEHASSTSNAFCYRARKAGHKAYVDFSVPVGHIGDFCYWPNSDI